MEFLDDVSHLLTLPRQLQPSALDALRLAHPHLPGEAWNTRFGPDSLYDAWARTPVMEGLYRHNVRAARAALDRAGRPFTALEIGVGDGTLWSRVLRPDDEGLLLLVDPVEEGLQRVSASLPPGVRCVCTVARIEEVLSPLPPLDLVVCSLVLHHVAGRDNRERCAHGLKGPGKKEILAHLARSLRGTLLLNEADVYCDVGLPPGDPALVDRVIDSYVRRTGLCLLGALRAGAPPALEERWRVLLRRWCLDQVDVCHAPLAARDGSELDVERWLAVLHEAGLDVVERRYTDDFGLFVQYLCRAQGEQTRQSSARS